MKLDGGAMALALGVGLRREELDNPGIPGTFLGDILGLWLRRGGRHRAT